MGYDSGGVLIQNSWGTGWGRQGFAYLNWDFVEQYSLDATVIPGSLLRTCLPSVSTGASAVALGPGSAKVSWSPPATNGGSTLTGYTVGRDGTATNGTGPWSTKVAAAARSFTFAKLRLNTTYHLTVRARNAVGLGPAAAVSGTTSAS